MIRFALDRVFNAPIRLLCLGAHCDDIEIGCGGALLEITTKCRQVEVWWVVLSSDGRRRQEAIKSSNLFLKDAASKNVFLKTFRNGYFPFVGARIKDYFESLKTKISPDIVFTHHGSDLHQDHRVVSELTWNTFRDNLILEYEIPKFDGDLGCPNLFIPLKKTLCAEKINIIMDSFRTQRDKHWFTKDLFFSLLRIRGMESRSDTGYAEGFYCRKSSLVKF